MDVISFAEASTANSRIEKVNANPDSNSGIVTVPSVIATGDSVTIPAGRTAVLPNLQVDGELVIDGEVFVPSGATFGDLETQIDTKANIDNPVFTGTVTLPESTNIGSVSSTELSYLDGVTSSIKTQLSSKQPTLVSGTNIKTINGTNILASGNITTGDLSTTSISLAGNGYMRLSNGFIIQWGFVPLGGNGDVSIVFPIAFPNSCLMLTNNAFNTTDGATYELTLQALSSSGAQFNRHASGGSLGGYYIAIGY